MDSKIQQALIKALYRVLRPMVRLLIRHGVSYRLFADVARHVYVDVAEQDFHLDGRKPSNARTAVLTGINRKDIAKLKNRPHPLSQEAVESPTPAARVITAWLNDKRFHNDAGQPLELTIEDETQDATANNANFTTLVKEYSSDVPVRALLDELIRIVAVERVDTDKVKLLVNGYIPIQDMQENLRIFGTAASDLLQTMDHNISGAASERFIQRTVSYDDIPDELLQQIRRRGRNEAEAFLLQVNDWLSQCDRQENKSIKGSGKARAGFGIYYIEHPSEHEPE